MALEWNQGGRWGVGLVMMAGVWAYGNATAPQTYRKSWLRKSYPLVADAVRRYMRKGERREDYAPALRIEGRRYFLVYYHDRKDLDRVLGGVLLDEQGKVIDDRDLFHRAARCKSAALITIDYNYHQRRAAEIQSFRGAMQLIRRVFDRLKEEREKLVTAGSRWPATWRRSWPWRRLRIYS